MRLNKPRECEMYGADTVKTGTLERLRFLLEDDSDPNVIVFVSLRYSASFSAPGDQKQTAEVDWIFPT